MESTSSSPFVAVKVNALVNDHVDADDHDVASSWRICDEP
jgi:hypothetical protein